MITVRVGRFMCSVASRANTSNHCCIAAIVMVVLASLLIDSGICAVEGIRLIWTGGGMILLFARIRLHSRIQDVGNVACDVKLASASISSCTHYLLL
jgi:hypothetical protein